MLVRGGVLLLVWNNRVPHDAFVAAFDEFVRRWNPAYTRDYRMQDWSGKIRASGTFTPAATVRFGSTWVVESEAFVGYARSISYLRNVVPRRLWPACERELRDLTAAHFGVGHCRVPLRTDVWWARRC